MTLEEFRQGLEPLVPCNSKLRPFVCTGSPLECHSFVVGFNPATLLPQPFWHYWSDEVGFNRKSFNKDYAKERKKAAAQAGKKIRQGNRLRIEAISCALDKCLETNLYALPTKKASYLAEDDKDWRIFEYLFRVIRPRVVSCTASAQSNSLRRRLAAGALRISRTPVRSNRSGPNGRATGSISSGDVVGSPA